MSDNDHHHHHHKSENVVEKFARRVSAKLDDIADAVKERKHSNSSNRSGSYTLDTNSANTNDVNFTLQDESPTTSFEVKQTLKNYDDTVSIGSIGSTASSNVVNIGPPRHTIDQLAVNMLFGGNRATINNTPSVSNMSISSATSLVNTGAPLTPTNSELKFEAVDDLSLRQTISIEPENEMRDRVITKIDPIEMTAKTVVETVPKDPVRRTAMLLAGPKFHLNRRVNTQFNLRVDTNTVYTVATVVGIISFILALWKPLSSYFSGVLVGLLCAGAACYILVRMYINAKAEETGIEEWVDFPALEATLAKCDKEDKNTNIQVTGASVAFQRYDADRDDDFVRYPCDLRLDGYRLIIQLASKQWGDEKKIDKDIKFIGYREYLIKEAKMILVPEATLTRAKYWLNDYPIIIQDLQILDKQIHNKQQLEKTKIDTTDFFTNTATILSIWFETGVQKEEWFHKISLVLRKGKEEIERSNSLRTGSHTSLASSLSTPSLHRRTAQNEKDTELIPNPVPESTIQAAISETQINAEELEEKAKAILPETDEVDSSGTQRTISRKSKKASPNEATLHKVLQSPECLDETAITINFMLRRLMCDMFEMPVFKEAIQNKIEMKLKEIAISILKNLRVVSLDVGNTFPVILKVEPMQWNTQGIWFNVFFYYRGSFKVSVRTSVLLQKLINYDQKKDPPIFAQHHSAQIVHKDDERIDEDDLVQRHKLLAKEPEIPEMAVTRKLGLALTNLALSKRFQTIANIPFVKSLFEKFSEKEVGADVEVTGFSGVLTLNIPPPPSDRIWVGFPEVPDMTIKVIPVYGENQYAYTLLQDFISARIKAELKRLVVLPAMDDQLLPLFRDWAIDIIGEIVSKPINPLTDNYKEKLNAQTSVQAGLENYERQTSALSSLATQL